ncbi:hypothetical protein TBS_10960 [Thermobispora bispora]|jgi:hypothetical protein|uniref:Uncharacterized protein n=2 Tax=Thermobispora bispora TaxID=2006 RepID=D6Y2E5_THEBD|nr:hypothetical protein Tbis_2082 [Thermobispora bispora DSM 43833]
MISTAMLTAVLLAGPVTAPADPAPGDTTASRPAQSTTGVPGFAPGYQPGWWGPPIWWQQEAGLLPRANDAVARETGEKQAAGDEDSDESPLSLIPANVVPDIDALDKDDDAQGEDDEKFVTLPAVDKTGPKSLPPGTIVDPETGDVFIHPPLDKIGTGGQSFTLPQLTGRQIQIAKGTPSFSGKAGRKGSRFHR